MSLYDCHCRQVAESSPNPSLVMITPHNFDPRLVFHRFISGYREKLSKTAIKPSLLAGSFFFFFFFFLDLRRGKAPLAGRVSAYGQVF